MYTFHNDPGHGWLAVPTAELVALGIRASISACSYLSADGLTAYLEEDCDAAVFLAARITAGNPLPRNAIKDQHHRGDCFIRRLARFPERTVLKDEQPPWVRAHEVLNAYTEATKPSASCGPEIAAFIDPTGALQRAGLLTVRA